MTIGGSLFLHGLSDAEKRKIKEGLTIENPAYWKMLRRGNIRAAFGIKKQFIYYKEQKDGTLILPRGCLERIRVYLKKKDLAWKEQDNCVAPPFSAPLTGTISPRPYQERLWSRLPLQETEGVFHLPTGYGKTTVAALLSQRLGLKTLIIVPRDAIFAQFEKEFQTWFGYEVGKIKGSVVKIKDITVASAESLSRKRELRESLKDQFGLVIIDEAHLFITEKRMAMLSAFQAKYIYGMTATPKRTDGQGQAIFFQFGDVVVTETIDRTSPEVLLVPFSGHIFVDEYANMVGVQTNLKERNLLIAQTAYVEARMGRQVLLLVKRIEHGRLLAEEIRKLGDSITHTVSSHGSAKDRKKLLLGMREGTEKFHILIGTYSMLSTGVDIPSLETLIFAGDLKSDVLVTQCAGRILRILSGKKEPKIYDIVDTGNPIFLKQAKERQKYYRSVGWSIKPA